MFGFFRRKNKKLLSQLESLGFEEIIKYGNNLLRSGNAEDGIECYKYAESRLDETDFNKPVALFSIANGYVFSGDFKNAKTYAQKALDSVPRSMENFAFDIEHPVKGQIEALLHHIANNKPTDQTKKVHEDNKKGIREHTNISDELVKKLGNRGILRLRLRNEQNSKYGFIRGSMRSITGSDIRYEFTELINYNEDNPLGEDEYNVNYQYIDLHQIVGIRNLKPPTFQQLKFEKFSLLMERLEEALYGDFNFEISPQGNVLFLDSDYIDSPVAAINTINVFLRDDNDWEVFNAMNFDLIVFKGDEATFKLTNEQVYGVYTRR